MNEWFAIWEAQRHLVDFRIGLLWFERYRKHQPHTNEFFNRGWDVVFTEYWNPPVIDGFTGHSTVLCDGEPVGTIYFN